MKTYKLPRWITGIYLALVALALATALFSQATFSAIFLVVLASPWAVPLTLLLDGISPNLLDHGFGIVALLVGCALNAAVLHSITSWTTWKLIKVPVFK